MFSWDESLTTGVPGIDMQHKMLIQACNELEGYIERGQGALSVKKTLVFLQFYAEWHFGREEKYMEKYHCPVADANKQAHVRFVERFGELFDQYRESGASSVVAHQVHAELVNWLVHHIKGTDTQLAASVKASERAVAVASSTAA